MHWRRVVHRRLRSRVCLRHRILRHRPLRLRLGVLMKLSRAGRLFRVCSLRFGQGRPSLEEAALRTVQDYCRIVPRPSPVVCHCLLWLGVDLQQADILRFLPSPSILARGRTPQPLTMEGTDMDRWCASSRSSEAGVRRPSCWVLWRCFSVSSQARRPQGLPALRLQDDRWWVSTWGVQWGCLA